MRFAIRLSLVFGLLAMPACGATAASMSSTAAMQRNGSSIVGVVTSTATMQPSPIAAEVHGRVVRVLRCQRGLHVIDPTPSSSASMNEAPGRATCAEDVECMRRLGRQMGADSIVVVQLAELGRTLALRIGFVDARSGTEQLSVQRIITAASRDRVFYAVDAAAYDFADRLRPVPRTHVASSAPWWMWPVVASGIAVVTGLTTFVIVDASHGRDSDERDSPVMIVPP